MEQLTESSTEEDYMTLKEVMEIGAKQYKLLNEKQKKIVDLVLNRLDSNTDNNHCFYIDDPSGSEKTFIFTTIYYLAKIKNKRVCTMAFTGIYSSYIITGWKNGS